MIVGSSRLRAAVQHPIMLESFFFWVLISWQNYSYCRRFDGNLTDNLPYFFTLLCFSFLYSVLKVHKELASEFYRNTLRVFP